MTVRLSPAAATSNQSHPCPRLELLAADCARLRYANAYTIQDFSTTPATFTTTIMRRIPGVQIVADLQPYRRQMPTRGNTFLVI
ncbi:MAG: hypothetical protein K6356_11130 [Chloroflexus sp.]